MVCSWKKKYDPDPQLAYGLQKQQGCGQLLVPALRKKKAAGRRLKLKKSGRQPVLGARKRKRKGAGWYEKHELKKRYAD